MNGEIHIDPEEIDGLPGIFNWVLTFRGNKSRAVYCDLKEALGHGERMALENDYELYVDGKKHTFN